jgi:DNA polymerase I-like protein with 3'-5' exonuclease and polymerase domains/5'-3' exonuclease
VWDGFNATHLRKEELPEYKAGRSKHDSEREQLGIARDQVSTAMTGLGTTIVQNDWCEADDVIGYLCKTLKSERNIVVTSDGDLNVLVDENTDVWRLGKLNENPYGPFPHKYITLYKSIVGDPSDKLKGAVGFGDVAFVDFVRTFGIDGIVELDRMIRGVKDEGSTLDDALDELKDFIPDLKSLAKILESKDLVRKCYKVASLWTDKVNTALNPLKVTAGMVQQWGTEGFQVHSLKRFYGTKTLVTANNYQAIYERLARTKFAEAPFVALDIETSSSEDSEVWLHRLKTFTESNNIDVLGHELTGMSLTFGANTQHTIYMSVDHKDTANITVDECRWMVELIPKSKHIIIQNRNFEFSVLYRTWGDKWQGNGWSGFVPNALDTKIGASYVDENEKKGLKHRSKLHLGYEQTSYEEVTTITLEDGTKRQLRMNQFTADHVFDYGCDDTICTAALHTYYKFVMDVEGTWQTYLDVETLPEYLTTLAFVQGIPMSMPTLVDMERRDDVAYEKAWQVLRDFLMSRGWEGSEAPEVVAPIEAADIKVVVEAILSTPLASKRRKLDLMALDIKAQFPDSEVAFILATALERGDVEGINALIKKNFTGEPKINFGSPKQIQSLFYNVIGITPRIINKPTDAQKLNVDMASAINKWRRAKKAKRDIFKAEYPYAQGDLDTETWQTRQGKTLTKAERDALISKASTDDTAVDSALAMDELTDEIVSVLKAYKVIKEVQTRRGLFYKTYKNIHHWRDGRIHPSLNQSEAVTRRYSSSAPNVQQLPSKGRGAAFREVLLAHRDDAVVVSLDFSGQELRLGAELSGDIAMTSCYIGDNLRDMHSLTAVAAAAEMWGEEVSYEDFQAMRKSKEKAIADKAKALRDSAKTVNFASQYGAAAPKIAETMMCDEETAQKFLDARSTAFPGIIEWDARVQAQAKKVGYARTMMGARRHLRDLTSDNSFERSKAERQVGNFWIQGSAAEMTKLAMARVWSSGIVTGKYDAEFLCPIHDELVFSVHKDHAVEFIKEAHACMVANYAGMKIPLESSIAIGPNFSADYEVGNLPDPEAIQKVLDEIFHINQEQRKAA